MTRHLSSNNIIGRQVYQVSDRQPYPNETYFRLVQVIIDGKRNYEGMVIVKSHPAILTYHEGGIIHYTSEATQDLTVIVLSRPTNQFP